MKLLIQTIVVIVAGIYLAMVVRQDPGYVLIGYGKYSVETSLAVFTLITLASLAVLYFVIRVLINVVFAPSKIRKWQDHRRDRVANTALTRGLMAQLEGKWRQSEKALLTYARKTDSAINYLAAARSAQAQGANERMNHYLEMAQATEPKANSAIRLTQAELLIDSKQYEKAEAALEHIYFEEPSNQRALLMLSRVYELNENWKGLSKLLFDLRRRKILPQETYTALEKTVYLNLLIKASKEEKMVNFANAWAYTPKHLQKDAEFVAVYVEKYINEGLHNDVENLLRSTIKTQWNDKLVYLYGVLYSDNPYNQLRRAEKWYRLHESDPTLLLTLGRLSSRSELWGKARSYLEASVENGGGPEAYHALAQVLEHIDEPELAASAYRKGLEIASDKGMPELAALTAKKKAKQAELEEREAEKEALNATDQDATNENNNEEKVAASAA